MPIITLPDGSQRSFEQPVSVLDVATDIGPGLAKATLAGVVDGTLRDARHVINDDASVQIITARDEAGLEIIRHSTAHLLAQAVPQRSRARLGVGIGGARLHRKRMALENFFSAVFGSLRCEGLDERGCLGADVAEKSLRAPLGRG